MFVQSAEYGVECSAESGANSISSNKEMQQKKPKPIEGTEEDIDRACFEF